MSLCETCIHMVTDGKKPVACMALVKYMPCDSCMFYEENPFSGKIQAEKSMRKLKETFIESVKERENQESEEITDLDTLFNKDSEKIRTSMENAMISVIGETIEEHFDDLDFIEVVRTSEEIFDKLSKFMCFKPMKKRRDEGIMEEGGLKMIKETAIFKGKYGYELIGVREERYLCSGYVELCKDYKKCRVLLVKEKNLLCYYDVEKERIYVTEYDVNKDYELDKKTLQELTDYVHWDNYSIYDYYYDWEESILCIRKKKC